MGDERIRVRLPYLADRRRLVVTGPVERGVGHHRFVPSDPAGVVRFASFLGGLLVIGLMVIASTFMVAAIVFNLGVSRRIREPDTARSIKTDLDLANVNHLEPLSDESGESTGRRIARVSSAIEAVDRQVVEVRAFVDQLLKASSNFLKYDQDFTGADLNFIDRIDDEPRADGDDVEADPDDVGSNRSPRRWMPMSRSNPTPDEERRKAKHHVGALLRWDHRRRIESLVSFLVCLTYVIIALISGWKLSLGKVPSWCVAPVFVCGTPFLLFIMSTMLRPSTRAGILERAFRDQTKLGKEVDAIGEMARDDEGIATQDELEQLEQGLSRLSREMERAMGAGANRFEIVEFVEASLKKVLGEHGVENRDIRRRVNEFIEANRI
ncbi:MAG: hypothetical protein CMJ51_05800 [Planctomycetaceae bacterium]|nr:hypothetical protein [Planctomycetaceae bacterium]